jgi:hypothetical protein
MRRDRNPGGLSRLDHRAGGPWGGGTAGRIAPVYRGNPRFARAVIGGIVTIVLCSQTHTVPPIRATTG